MRCQICHAYIPEGAEKCLECGSPLEPEQLCQKCGAIAGPAARFCRKCGAALTPPPKNALEDPISTASSAKVTCFRCGTIVPTGIKYCPSCGINLEKRKKESENLTQAQEKLSNCVKPIEGTKCPSCGTELRGTGRFCYECGRFLGTDLEDVICPSCGAIHSMRYSRCQYCGKEIPRP